MLEHTIPDEFIELANVQARAEDELLAKPNVVGVALGHRFEGDEDTGEPALCALVEAKLPLDLLSEEDLVASNSTDLSNDVPDGVPIDEQEVGIQTLRGRRRPAMGGDSVGHYRITAGTLGTCCYDLRPFPGMPPKYYILSNNHVLANSNDAKVGDPILQPGPIDGGKYPQDMIARLSRWIPIKFGSGGNFPCNYVDAAIAEGAVHDLNREIYWGGYVKRLYQAPTLGEIVQKTGRTTNFSTGTVRNINATVMVNYGGSRVAKFCRQILTTPMSAGGDSGSIVLDRDENGVGLLFAGSSQVTIMNHLIWVQALLGVRITEK